MSSQIASHATVIFLSYLAFFVAVVSGILFLAQERRLKKKDPRILRDQPIPLELLDRINWAAVVVGFFLFSVGMIQGHLLARTNWGSFWTGDPKEIWSLLTWGCYAAVLALRLTAGLKGRRVIFMSVMSFLLVMFTFVGVNYWIGGRHVFF